MKIKHGIILAAGLGKRMLPITLKKPKPLINIGDKTLLERTIKLLITSGVEEISINIHHLSDQIEKYILKFKGEANFYVSDEKELLLDTGGGVKKASKKFNDNPFFVINPDTIWGINYLKEIELLEKKYFEKKKPCLLLVKKQLSFDKSFNGDFNLTEGLVTRDKENEYIFTGLQIIKNNNFEFIKEKVFSMNDVWSELIRKKNLFGLESEQKFYHLNSIDTYKKISLLKLTN